MSEETKMYVVHAVKGGDDFEVAGVFTLEPDALAFAGALEVQPDVLAVASPQLLTIGQIKNDLIRDRLQELADPLLRLEKNGVEITRSGYLFPFSDVEEMAITSSEAVSFAIGDRINRMMNYFIKPKHST